MTKDPDGRTAGEYSGSGGDHAAGGGEGAPEVHSITSAAPGHSVDMHQRMVRYSVAMGIRVVCIVALFFLDGWFKLVAVAGAVFLPWIAVVIANAQTQAETYDSEILDHIPYGELGSTYLEDDGDDSQGETIPGETVDDADADAEGPRDEHGEPGEHGPERPEAGAA